MSRCSGDDCFHCDLLKEAEAEIEVEEEKDWYFTFGFGHMYRLQSMAGKYAVFHGTYESAREKMIEKYLFRWAFQYGSAEEAGVDRWNLKKV